MARPTDPRRRQDLLDQAVDYVLVHGLTTLSLRPLAAALGTDASVLLHHFGSKDQLLVLILNSVRDRLREVARHADDSDPAAQVRAVWTWASDPQREPLYRLFFEAYGLALRNPERFGDFLDHVVADWIAQLTPAASPATATLAIATIRGLLLDLLTTGERARIEEAVVMLERLVAADS